MNVSTRIISDSELMRSYKTVNEILQNKKKLGEKFGKIRDKLAEILKVSSSQIKKIENISHNAIEEVKNAVETGEISIHTANEIAKLDNEKQTELIEEIPLDKMKPKNVKNKKGGTSSTFFENENQEENDDDIITFTSTPKPKIKDVTGLFRENNSEPKSEISETENEIFSERNMKTEENSIIKFEEITQEKIEFENAENFEKIENREKFETEKTEYTTLNIRIKQEHLDTLKTHKSTIQNIIEKYLIATVDDDERLVMAIFNKVFLEIESEEKSGYNQIY
jgi:hypothetical protein